MISDKRYVLDDREDEELERLGLQHGVWSTITGGMLHRAGFHDGQHVVDLGCGPGFLSADLARIVGAEGRVTAVDISEKFIAHLRASCPANVRATLDDVSDVRLDVPADGAVMRWVMMFLPDPDRVIANAARIIRRGGYFASLEYHSFRSISLWPRSAAFQRTYAAVYDLICGHGGDPDIGSRVPEIMARNGFEVIDSYPIFCSGRPGTPMWKWLEATGRNHTNLVEGEFITRDQLDEYYSDWRDRSGNPHSYFVAPPVTVTIGRKH